MRVCGGGGRGGIELGGLLFLLALRIDRSIVRSRSTHPSFPPSMYMYIQTEPDSYLVLHVDVGAAQLGEEVGAVARGADDAVADAVHGGADVLKGDGRVGQGVEGRVGGGMGVGGGGEGGVLWVCVCVRGLVWIQSIGSIE